MINIKDCMQKGTEAFLAENAQREGAEKTAHIFAIAKILDETGEVPQSIIDGGTTGFITIEGIKVDIKLDPPKLSHPQDKYAYSIQYQVNSSGYWNYSLSIAAEVAGRGEVSLNTEIMPNFSQGPISCQVVAIDAQIEEVLEKARKGGMHGNEDPLAMPLLEALLSSSLPDEEARKFLQGVKDDPYKCPVGGKPVEDLRIFLAHGRVIEHPATSSGRGEYYSWEQHGNLYVDYQWQDVSYSENGEAWLNFAFAE